MTFIELIGWAAAAMTLLALTARDLWLLRMASLGASMAFIVYAAATATWRAGTACRAPASEPAAAARAASGTSPLGWPLPPIERTRA